MRTRTCEIDVETDRLLIKNMRCEEVTRQYVEWLNDPEVNRYLNCRGVEHTTDSCRQYVESYYGRADVALYGLFMKGDMLHIGNITLSSVDWKNSVGVVGISIGRKEMWGKGLAREALSAVMEHCFEGMGLHRLQAGVHAKNYRSLKLFVQCGFKIEGLMRDSSLIDGEYYDGYMLAALR